MDSLTVVGRGGAGNSNPQLLLAHKTESDCSLEREMNDGGGGGSGFVRQRVSLLMDLQSFLFFTFVKVLGSRFFFSLSFSLLYA